jgi:hypothetical protein
VFNQTPVHGILAFTLAILGPNQLFSQEKVRLSGVVEADLPTGPIKRSEVQRSPTNINVTQNLRPQNETSIAVDPNNTRNLVAGTNDYRYGQQPDAGFAYSFDGGQTWQSNT